MEVEDAGSPLASETPVFYLWGAVNALRHHVIDLMTSNEAECRDQQHLTNSCQLIDVRNTVWICISIRMIEYYRISMYIM